MTIFSWPYAHPIKVTMKEEEEMLSSFIETVPDLWIIHSAKRYPLALISRSCKLFGLPHSCEVLHEKT